jgi:hypothetical protein
VQLFCREQRKTGSLTTQIKPRLRAQD